MASTATPTTSARRCRPWAAPAPRPPSGTIARRRPIATRSIRRPRPVSRGTRPARLATLTTPAPPAIPARTTAAPHARSPTTEAAPAFPATRAPDRAALGRPTFDVRCQEQLKVLLVEHDGNGAAGA